MIVRISRRTIEIPRDQLNIRFLIDLPHLLQSISSILKGVIAYKRKIKTVHQLLKNLSKDFMAQYKRRNTILKHQEHPTLMNKQPSKFNERIKNF